MSDLESIAMGAALDFARCELERNAFAAYHRAASARCDELERGLVAAELREQKLKAELATWREVQLAFNRAGGHLEVVDGGYSMLFPTRKETP